jgi:transcriptional regulator with XRE-family HTH domain
MDDLDVLNALKVAREGIAPVTLAQLKTGRRNPSTGLLDALAEVTGSTTDEVLGRVPVAAASVGANPGAIDVPGVETE